MLLFSFLLLACSGAEGPPKLRSRQVHTPRWAEKAQSSRRWSTEKSAQDAAHALGKW